MSGLSPTDLTSSPDALSSAALTSTSTQFAGLSSQARNNQTPSEPHRLENVSIQLSPGLSENPTISPLFPIGDISFSALENAVRQRLPVSNPTFCHNHEHENFHDHDSGRSNTTQLQNDIGHNISFSEQARRSTTLPQQGDSWDCDSLWRLLDPANGNQENLTSIFPNQGTQYEPQISMPGLEESQRASIEEAIILQFLSSTRNSSSMPNDALSAIDGLLQQVQHHHHFHNHHYHHH